MALPPSKPRLFPRPSPSAKHRGDHAGDTGRCRKPARSNGDGSRAVWRRAGGAFREPQCLPPRGSWFGEGPRCHAPYLWGADVGKEPLGLSLQGLAAIGPGLRDHVLTGLLRSERKQLQNRRPGSRELMRLLAPYRTLTRPRRAGDPRPSTSSLLPRPLRGSALGWGPCRREMGRGPVLPGSQGWSPGLAGSTLSSQPGLSEPLLCGASALGKAPMD